MLNAVQQQADAVGRYALPFGKNAGQLRKIRDIPAEMVKADDGNIFGDFQPHIGQLEHDGIGNLITEGNEGSIIQREKQFPESGISQGSFHLFTRNDPDVAFGDAIFTHGLHETFQTVNLGTGTVFTGQEEVLLMTEPRKMNPGEETALTVIAADIVCYDVLDPAVQQHKGHVVFLHDLDVAAVVHIGKIQNAVHRLGDGGADQMFAQLFIEAHAQHHDVVSGLPQFAVHDGKHITEVQVMHVIDDNRDIAASSGTKGRGQGVADIAHPDSGFPDFCPGGFRKTGITAERPGNRINGIAAGTCDIPESNAVDSHTAPSIDQINVITNSIS